jgi:1,4-dihydroxy-2-naphthoyl-CoA hydrolase
MNVIWNPKVATTEIINNISVNTMAEFLEIKFTEIGPDFLKATMPVGPKTHQPYGLLHGGASAVLAETAGSVASWMVIDTEHQICVGIEINCNHVRAKKNGIVTATVTPLHIGTTTHVWDIKIHNEQEKLICVSRLTVAIRSKKDQNNPLNTM